MKILIAEDDVNSRVFLERALQSQGYTVESAANGLEALEKAVLSAPDLIISDILMPKMDGFELCRRVKTDERLNNIPFVFYTATYTDKKDEDLAMSLGASRFLIKPMEPEAFFDRIKEVIEEHRTQTLPVPDHPLVDMKELDRLQIEALARKLDKKVRELEKERKKLQRVRGEWEDIFQAIGHPTIILDPQHNILSANRAAVKAAGVGPAEELTSRKCHEIFHNAAEPPEGCPLVRMLSSGKFEESEMEVEALGGVFHVSCTPVFDEKGDLQKIIHIATDVTERKRAEEALRFSEERYRSVVENIGIGISLISPNMEILALNKQMKTWFPDIDVSSRPICFRSFNDPPREEVCSYCPTCKTLQDGQVHEAMTETPAKDTVIFFRVISSPVKDQDGRIIAAIEMVEDITERKLAEEALRKEKTFSEAMINSLPGIFCLFDENGHFIKWNRYLDSVSEYSYEEIEKMDPLDFFSGEEKALVGDSIHEVFVKGESHVEANIISKYGRKTPFYFKGLRFMSENRPYLIGIGIDITERKKFEDDLRASEEELYNSFFAQSAINMILSESLEEKPLEEILQKALNMILSVPWLSFEAVGSIHLVEGTPGILSMKAQYNLPEQLRKSCAHVFFGECLCGKAALTQKIEFADHIDERHWTCYEGMEPHGHYIVPVLFGGRTLGVIDIYLKEGHIRDEQEEEFLLTIADTLAGIISRRQTEDEKEKLHAQLLQAQKMEAIGQLAGGIAHDFNNILTAMIGYGHLLKMKLKEEGPLRAYADHILSLSDRAANLTQSLLAFSRKRIINPRPADLNEIIRTVEKLLSRIIGEDIQLKTVLSERDLVVMADHVQIEQALMNLAMNARDAMPAGGLLGIETETADIDAGFIKEHGFGKEGSYALISVTDTGTGMDKETREKIFEPFFTTKEVGRGTGLGLAMVYGIIKQHDGHINAYSEPGRGTTFRIYLPLIKEKVEEITPEVIQPVETGTETVLLAEDEPEVRVFTGNLLKEYGYKVITAADGQEAINEFRVYRNKIQLVILDVIMPNKNGKEVYDEIRQIAPDIKVLFMSGYPADSIRKRGIIEDGFAYIEKPASPVKLLRKIREVLGK